MSQTAAAIRLPLRDAQETATHSSLPGLRAVTYSKPAPKKLGLAAVCGLFLIGVVALQVLLTNIISADAYTLSSLYQQQRDTARVQRVLEQSAEALNSPQNLATRAQQLGMVQNSTPGYLRMSDGAVLGEVAAATGEPLPNTVANATIAGVGVAADENAAAAASDTPELKPENWEGQLPAPVTR